MAEVDPANREEWTERFQRGYHIVRDGLFMESHVPCAFCACPGFQILGILTAMEDMRREVICQFCGRSGKVIVGDHMKVEFVQTGGEDPPPYLIPAPRRLAPGE